MVAKINYGASIYGAVSYNQEKVDARTATIIHTHKMIKNMNGAEDITFSQTLLSFEDYLQANNRTKKPVAHFSLNPSPEDKLTDSELTQLAERYMEAMGYKDQPYIVYKHSDIEREHIHIVSIRVDEHGKKISDSKDWERSMAICRQLEIDFNLKQITDKAKEETTLYLKKVDYKKGDIKRQISNTVKTLSKDYTFQTFGEYNALLSCFNIHSKLVKGEEDGNLYNGMIYCATDDEGELKGHPIKSSRIGKAVGYDAINKLIAKNKQKEKNGAINLSKPGNIIRETMKKCKDKKSFINELKKNNIDVVFRENDKGRIYGVTFIDHAGKTVFNGSRVGKELSANTFNDLFSQHKGINDKPYDKINDYIPHESIKPIAVDEIFGSFYLNASSFDPEEEEFRRRMQRKKKRKKKRNL